MKWLSLCVSIFLSAPCFSQQVDHENYELERVNESVPGFFFLHLAAGLPDASFKKAMNSDYGDMALGFSSGFGINPYGKKRESPLLLGIDFSYYTFGRDKTTDPVTSIRYKTSFNSIFVGPMARVYPFKTKKIRPFLDGHAGLRILNGRTKLDKTIFDDTEEEVLIGSENDSGFGYGIGLGIHPVKNQGESEEARASFSLRVVYTWGERSKYIKRNSVTVVDDELQYQTGFTSTSMLQIQLGITIY